MPELEHFDVAVVGSGVAGALIAHRLALRGHRVVMLEAGEIGRERVDLVGTYALAAQKTPRSPYADVQPPSPVVSPDNENDYIQTGPLKFKSTYLRRVGGSTWHMLGNMPRLVPGDFKLRRLYGVGVDWPIDYDDLEPWYGEAESALGVSGDHEELDGLLGAHRSRPFPMSKIWPSYGDLEVGRAIGGLTVDGTAVMLSTTPQARNSRPYDGRPACAGNSSCVPICPIGAKYDASVHVRKAEQAGAVLRQRCVVARLVVDPATRRVVSVEYIEWTDPTRPRFGLSATFVVVAAHAIETPRLLLLSADPEIAPNGVANGSDQVGRNLMDHLQGQGAAIVSRPLYPFRGPPTTVGIDTFRDGPFRATHAAFRLSIGNDGMGRTESPYDTLATLLGKNLIGTELKTALRDRVSRQFRISYSTEMLPSADNRVSLASGPPDDFGLARAQLSVGLDDYNRRAFAKAQAVISAVFDRLEAPSSERRFPPNLDSYSGAGHILGTTRMGTDPATSVLNSECRAHEHDNLYIVGASAFPTGGTANPTLTVAALALRAADTLDTRLRRGP
jgi:choline dehydrogenase-like flavoprotein